MKYALITGGSRGIGAAAARLCARRGWGVAVGYRRSEAQALALVQELSALGVPAIAVQADVSDAGQIRRMVDNVLEIFCQLDILICSAGISHVGLISQIDEAQWRNLFAVNVDGVHHCCRAVLPHMLHEKAGGIVNISSIWGLRGASCEVAYAASKAAVIGLTRSLAMELAPSHIRVNCVAPGVIETDMVRGLGEETLASLVDQTPAGRLRTPEDVARAVSFFLRDDADFITGQVLTVDGGFIL